jgi:MoxR-like ATPase
MLKIRIGYPPSEDERKMITGRQTAAPVDSLQPVIRAEEVCRIQERVLEVSVDSTLVDYLMEIVGATRHSSAIELGVSPRGAITFMKAAQARALAMGRDYCVPDDIKELAIPCLAHRIIPASRLETNGPRTEAADHIVREILNRIPVPV